MALLKILSTASINQQKTVLPALQIKPNIGRISFYRELRKKMELSLLRSGDWRFKDQ
jgi:hypothetical protein